MQKNWRQIEGKNPVLEALRAGNKINKLFLDSNITPDAKVREIIQLCRDNQIEVVRKGTKNIYRMSVTQANQGIIAYAPPLPDYSFPHLVAAWRKTGKEPLIVILPKVLYEYNLGAVARTCEAAGVDCLVINKKNELGPGVSRSSMGAIEYLPIVFENLFIVAGILHDEGIPLIAAHMDASENYYDVDLSGPLALLVGSEDQGISKSLTRNIDREVKIPMFGKINSLNMSVATGVLLYEAVRQRAVKNEG